MAFFPLLLQVIYALNTKNDEHEAAIATLKEAHEEEVQQILSETREKILQVYTLSQSPPLLPFTKCWLCLLCCAELLYERQLACCHVKGDLMHESKGVQGIYKHIFRFNSGIDTPRHHASPEQSLALFGMSEIGH